MTVTQLFPPIAIATVFMLIWVAVAWRWQKASTPGQESLLFCLWMLIVPAIGIAYYYFGNLATPVTKGWQVMIATMFGEGFAIIIIFALNKAFFSAEKQGMKIYMGVLAAVFTAFFFYSSLYL